MSIRKFIPGLREQVLKEQEIKEEHNQSLERDKNKIREQFNQRFDIKGWEDMTDSQKRGALKKMVLDVLSDFQKMDSAVTYSSNAP